MARLISRRRFVGTGTLFAGSLWWRGGVAEARVRNLRGGEILPDPDCSLLRETSPHLIGIRPYRTQGVRLELVAAPLGEGTRAKRLIHNYGHGGAGVTLSWGCASVVTDHIDTLIGKSPPASAKIAVLGSGIVGLTTATEIHRRWPELPITVYAKDLDLTSTVSWVAGGQFEPSGMHRLYRGPERLAVLHDYMRRSHDRVVQIQNSGRRHAYGVAVRKNYTLDRKLAAFETGVPQDAVPAPRRGRLPFKNLNMRGHEYQTWLQNPIIMMPQLVEDLKAAGVKFEARHFRSTKDLVDLPETLVVNCTGLGSRELFNDDALIPQRGHNVVLKKADERQFYFFSGGCENRVIAYIFCRQDDIVVGGTVQPGNDSLARTEEDDAIFAMLQRNGEHLFAGRVSACVRG